MKVLFTFGGIPLYLDRLLETLAGKGVEVVVVHPEGRSAVIGQNVEMSRGEKSYRIVRTPETKGKLSRKPRFAGLPAILEAEKPDIVVLGWPYFLDLCFNRSLLRTIRKNNICLMIREIPFQVPPYKKMRAWFREHPVYDEQMNLKSKGLGFYLNQIGLRRIRRFVYRRADGTLNYASIAYDILPGYGVDPEKIFVTYNSPDNAALWDQRKAIEASPRLLPENPHRILHIGRLVRWKRVDLLIAAARKLSEQFPETELVVVGDGPELENLKRQAREEGIADWVRFVGAVYDPFVLGQYMRESAVYVLAGMGGLSINEAMAFGLPVICSVADGTEKDLIEPGTNGLFFREGDAGSLAEKLTELFSDDERRLAMGRRAEETIREKINLDTVSDRFIGAFQTVMR